ncbi:MAG: S8 family serine peptidase [Chloroflexi bacterium]|nr:S8 family serine peptidase [Chloroflexota bacterium]
MKKIISLLLILFLSVISVFQFTSQTIAQTDTTIHKVIDHDNVLGNIDGAQLLEDYGSYQLYTISGDSLGQLSQSDQSQVTVVDDMDMLLFSAQPFDTQTDSLTSLNLPDQLTAVNVSGEALHLVQFIGPIKDEWLKAVADTGVEPIHYIANNAYMVWANDGSRAQLDAMVNNSDFVQFSVPHQPYFKIGDSIRSRILENNDPDEIVTVTVQIYDHKSKFQSVEIIETAAVEQLASWTNLLKFENIIINVHANDLETLATLPDVVWVGERFERELMDEVQGQIVAGNLNGSGSGPVAPGYLAWLNSFGFSSDPNNYPIVDVTDDGIGNGTTSSGDETFHESGLITQTTRLAYVANCTDSASGEGPDGHGHINTSIVGGYDTRGGFPFHDPNGYQRGLGINPYGRMAGTRIFDPGFDQSSCGGTDTGVIKSIQDNGALINTNSWGCSGCAGTYDDGSQAYDVGVRDADLTEAGNQEMIVVFSSGNSGPSSGTVGTPGNGKNMITVGASENDRPSDEDGSWTDGCAIGPTGADNAMDVISFSSRGPSPGNRVKPEVIAPGTHIQGTASTNASYNGTGACDQYRPSGQTEFASSSGTSHSTPAVAGVSSLYYHWLENTYGITPSPALMKAYLIAHPTYLTGVSANDTLPSNSQGYGMPNMDVAFDNTDRGFENQTVIFDNSGETWTWTGGVADPAKPVRIVLAYTDAAGAIGTSPQVNDLNLDADVNGTNYLGNVFSGEWSTTGGVIDGDNNYEAIFLPAGTTGTIQITITAFNIAGDGVPNVGDGTDQDFALVCYNCQQFPDFTLSAIPTSQSICSPSDAVYSVAVGQITGFTDPVTLSAQGEPAGTTVSFAPNGQATPYTSTFTIGNTGAAAFGSYNIDVVGVAPTSTHTTTIGLDLFTAAPTAPTLTTPADGATNVSFKPNYTWTAATQAEDYYLEVATDAGFTNLVYTATVTTPSYTPTANLSASATYYWRVTANNVCGAGGTSSTFSFTVQAATMVCNGTTVDFESGIPGDWTVVDNTGGAGIVWDLVSSASCGIGNLTNGSGDAACADSDAAGSGSPPYDTELVSNPFDLVGVGSVTLDVAAYYNNLGAGNDLFEVDVWDGSTWTNELTWDENHQPEDINLDLTAYSGLTGVQIRFRYSGNGYDWYAQVDDVNLSCASGPDIQLNKTVGTDATVCAASNNITVFSGADVTYCYEVTNTGTVTFTTHDLVDSELGVIFNNLPFPLAPLSSAFITQTANITTTTVNTATWTATNGPDTAMDTAGATVNAVVSAAYPVCEGFEGGVLPNFMFADVTSNGTSTGRVQVTTNFPNTGSYGLDLDTDCGGACSPTTQQAAVMLVDLAGQSSVELNFWVYEHTDENNPEDGVFISDDGGVTWANIFSLNGFPASYLQVILDLDAAAAGAGMSYVDGFMIRFQSLDNFDLSWDGYSFDDICVQPRGPDIAVSPSSLSSAQFANEIMTSTLTISNFGSGSLDWNISEAAANCGSPGDLSWLQAVPISGTVASQANAAVDVGFNSSGAAPGTYNGNLCVNSNDPDTAVFTVPVTLTVTPVPIIGVTPGSLASGQGQNSFTTHTLTISNTGTTTLTWTIDEAQTTSLPPVSSTTSSYSVAAAGTAETANGLNSAIPGNVLGNGPSITGTLTSAPPTIDGLISAGEWDDALIMDISTVANPVMMYVKHDGNMLYLAFDDQNDTTSDTFDQIGVYFDDEGGTAPTLYDNLWTNAACAGTNNTGEGNFWLGNFAPDADDRWRELIVGPTTCTPQLGGTNVQIAYGLGSGNMQYETAIPLDGSSAMTATAGDTMGYRVYVLDNATGIFNGRFPNPSTFNDPSTYGNLHLDSNSTGCNNPQDLPWLSVNPTSGSTLAGSSSAVDVTMDATSLSTGVYTGTLCVRSNDTLNALVQVPVTMTVSVPSYGVSLSTADADMSDITGQTVTYTLTITNEGNVADTFDLTTDGNSYTTTVTPNAVALNLGESTTVWVTVDIPAAAASGDTDMVTVTATSQGDSSTAMVDLTTTVVEYQVDLGTDDADLTGGAGDTLTYTVKISNTGSMADSFTLSLSGETWTSNLSTTNVTLGAGEMTTVMVTVVVPAAAANNDTDTVTVTATSDTDATATATLDLTSTAAVGYTIYLPTIMKP